MQKAKSTVRFLISITTYLIILTALPACYPRELEEAVTTREESKRLPAVFLNHLFIVLDSVTYNAIVESDFIRNEFCGFEQRTTTTNGGETWSGSYCYGEATYIEFFEGAGGSDFGLRECGIAFGVELEGGVDAVYEAFLKNFEKSSVTRMLRTLNRGDEEAPWFLCTGVKQEGAGTSFTSWVMEYHKEFTHTMAPKLYSETGNITRKDYLRRVFFQGRLLKNIREIILALGQAQASAFLNN